MILYFRAIILKVDLNNIKSDKYTELHSIIYNERRFILNYKSIIEMVSFQIYNSALIFSSVKNII
jgi:hypothetical protein